MSLQDLRVRSAEPPEPARVETSYSRITDLLLKEILTGQIALGEWLRMRTVAARFNVSVQPVREALQQLEGEGLVEMIPNRGARVRTLDRQRLIHAHEIGEALESYLAHQFAEEASLSAVREAERLQVAHDAAIAELDWAKIDETNFAFHRFINTHGGNHEAAELISRYYGLCHTLLNSRGRGAGYAARVKSEHHALLKAFRSRDGEAARRINAKHVNGTLKDVLAAFEETLR